MNDLDKVMLDLVNNWHINLSEVDSNELVKFEYSKDKFRNKYASKTGEFLKITKKLEAYLFSKICFNLSKNYDFSEKLLDEYLEWCFDNYDFFVKKYKAFNLNNITSFSSEWRKNLFNFISSKEKISFDDLNNLSVSQNVFFYFEQYGIPFAATKFLKETKLNKTQLSNMILDKLDSLTNTKEGLNKLKNMIRNTVENGPYDQSFLFHNYKKDLEKIFKYFSNEPWSK